MDEINQFERAALAWEALTRASDSNDVIRYKNLGDEIGIHHRAVRYVLAIIQEYCLKNHLPPITILAVGQNKLPGSGFIAWDANNIEEGFNQVYNFNWNNLENPFRYAITGQSEEQIVEELLSKPEKSSDVYAQVKVRGTAQAIFRKALLKAYGNKCVFCDLSFEFSLQAAHIIPWAKASNSQRMDVRNGLLLCANHHCLFDAGILSVNTNYQICFNIKKNHKPKTEYDRLLTTALNGKSIKLPLSEKHYPDHDYLSYRTANI